MQLGRLGVWTWLDALTAPEAVSFARRIEAWGYSTLWVPEGFGRDPFATLSMLATSTTRLTFATSIANIYARDAMAMRAAIARSSPQATTASMRRSLPPPWKSASPKPKLRRFSV